MNRFTHVFDTLANCQTHIDTCMYRSVLVEKSRLITNDKAYICYQKLIVTTVHDCFELKENLVHIGQTPLECVCVFI